MNGRPVEREDLTRPLAPAFRHRVSWGAIWAGMFVTILLQVMFTLLGVAVGIASLNPVYSSTSAQTNLTIGAAIWMLVSWLVSVWIGACVAGWMSGGPRRADGTVHGIVVWSFAGVVILLLMSGAAGAVLGGANSMLSGTSPNSEISSGNQQQSSQSNLAPTGRTGTQQQSSQSENTPSQNTRTALWGSSLYGFIALILGLAVAAWGGSTGAASASERVLTATTTTPA